MDVLRQAAWTLAPGLMADRARRYQARLWDTWGLTIEAGPFVGLRFPPDLRGVDTAMDKLLGRYEAELHPALETLLTSEVFVDMGSADGYYAVGAALRGCEVHAYEVSRNARRLSAKVARLNGVTIHQHRAARIEFPDAAILCDIEGQEADLFTREACARLTGPAIVETHEDVRPGVTDLLAERFNRPCEVIRSPQVKGRVGETCWLIVEPR